MLVMIAENFIVVFGWAKEEIKRRVDGPVEEVIFFRFEIFLQHPPEVLFMVATREFSRSAGVPASSWGDGSCI